MCGEVVVFLYDELHQHMKAKHKTTLFHYRTQYMEGRLPTTAPRVKRSATDAGERGPARKTLKQNDG
jgi:hypothetical protein